MQNAPGRSARDIIGTRDLIPENGRLSGAIRSGLSRGGHADPDTRRALHEPYVRRVTDPRSGPRLCEAQRFMVPMRVQRLEVESNHEPELGAPASRRRVAAWVRKLAGKQAFKDRRMEP
jgi:hypothetical protein